MNNLEKELLEAFEDLGCDKNDLTIAAASVAMKWIEKAFEAGGIMHPSIKNLLYYRTFEDYAATVGLTPTEPDTKEPWKVIPTDGKVDATND